MNTRPRALILTHHLFELGGSELVAIEVANALANHGAEVEVYTPFFDLSFLKNAFREGVTVVEKPADLSLCSFDLVYCHHQVLSVLIAPQFPSLMAEKKLPYIVYNHLSGHEPFEFPGPFIEAEVADEIWCNSVETQRALARFGDRFHDAKVVPNPAPAGFKAEPATGCDLKNILSISNHLPSEVNDALDILAGRGVGVEKIGRPNHARRVVPDDIKNADALISIGKSVQYALVAHRPVYCYDWFGGPGWLTAENFVAAADHNFSGRCTRSVRSAVQIADEILVGFKDARTFANSLNDGDLQDFLWPRHIAPLLGRARAENGATKGRLRHVLDAVSGVELPKHWRHEADLYGLIDREYGKARNHQARGQALAAQITALKAGQNKGLSP
jgi:hypothetical protein